MISDCALKPPEKYIFRWGITIGAALVGLLSVGVYYTTRTRAHSKLLLVLGLVGCMGLSVVAVVNEEENHLVHDIFALIFFGCFDVYMVLTIITEAAITKRLAVCSLSFFLKLACSILGLTGGVGYGLFVFGTLLVDEGSILVALFEWVNTFVVLIFIWTYTLDKFLYDIDICEIRNSTTSPKQNEGHLIEKNLPEVTSINILPFVKSQP
jgi:alpha-L-fucosidase